MWQNAIAKVKQRVQTSLCAISEFVAKMVSSEERRLQLCRSTTRYVLTSVVSYLSQDERPVLAIFLLSPTKNVQLGAILKVLLSDFTSQIVTGVLATTST